MPRVNDLNQIEKLLFYSELPCLGCSLLVSTLSPNLRVSCVYIYIYIYIYSDLVFIMTEINWSKLQSPKQLN